MIVKKMECLVEDSDKSCISLRNVQNEDVEEATVPKSILEAVISMPFLSSTAVNIKKLVEEVKKTKLKLQKTDKIINQLHK